MSDAIVVSAGIMPCMNIAAESIRDAFCPDTGCKPTQKVRSKKLSFFTTRKLISIGLSFSIMVTSMKTHVRHEHGWKAVLAFVMLAENNGFQNGFSEGQPFVSRTLQIYDFFHCCSYLLASQIKKSLKTKIDFKAFPVSRIMVSLSRTASFFSSLSIHGFPHVHVQHICTASGIP